VREFATHDDNAILLADGSPAAIAAEVLGLAGDLDRLARLAHAGVRGLGSFSIDGAARSQLELFAGALQSIERSATVRPA